MVSRNSRLDVSVLSSWLVPTGSCYWADAFCLWSCQDSVLVTTPYSLYTTDLGSIRHDKEVASRKYAYDTQAYVHGPAAAAALSVDKAGQLACIGDLA